jgi:ribonuclease PH
MDAGVPLKSTCSAISVMVHKDGQVLLDPTALELEVILFFKE